MLVSKQELANLKLQSIKADGLKELAETLTLYVALIKQYKKKWNLQ